MFSPRFPREQHGSLWELTLSKEMLQTWFNTLGLTDREPATVYRGVCCDGHALRTSKKSKIASRFLRTHSQITWEMKGPILAAHLEQIILSPQEMIQIPHLEHLYKDIASKKKALLFNVHHTRRQAEFNLVSQSVWPSVVCRNGYARHAFIERVNTPTNSYALH